MTLTNSARLRNLKYRPPKPALNRGRGQRPSLTGGNNEAQALICFCRHHFGTNHTIGCAIHLACWSLHQEARWRRRNAGGIPRPRGLTAADCALIVVGTIERNTFQGEVKYELDASELEAQRKAVLDYLKGGSSSSDINVEPDLMMSITFAPQSATVNDVDWGPRGPCPEHTGIFGRYTKDRSR